MKWCKFVAFFDNFDDFISDDCGACKLLAAMDNTVTNCIDLFKRFDNAVFSVCQTIKNELDCFCMGRHWRFDCHLLAAGWCVNNTAAVNANSFTKAFCLYSFCCHVD